MNFFIELFKQAGIEVTSEDKFVVEIDDCRNIFFVVKNDRTKFVQVSRKRQEYIKEEIKEYELDFKRRFGGLSDKEISDLTGISESLIRDF